jgi:hypothetical protein
MHKDDEPIGYKRPPKHSQYKKGQSGAPDGGWDRRRANQARKKKMEEEKALKDKLSLAEKLEALLHQKRSVMLNGQKQDMTNVEVCFLRLQEDAIKGDEKARALYAKIAGQLGAFDRPPPADKNVGVIVIPAPARDMEEFMERYGDQRTTVNPLEGLPGIDPALIQQRGRSTRTPGEHED